MLATEIKTASQLKAAVESSGNNCHFFSRPTMKFFGDTMRNYSVSGPIDAMDLTGTSILVYVLRRRKPVKHGLMANAYFCAKTFRRVFPQ